MDISDQVDTSTADSEQVSDVVDNEDATFAPDAEVPAEEIVDPADPLEPSDPTTPIQDETVSKPDSSVEPVQNEVESSIENDSSLDTALECPPPQKILLIVK